MQAVFFDLDDTLIDSRAAIARAAEALRATVALDVEPAAFAAAWSRAHTRHYPLFLDGSLPYHEVRRRRIRDTVSRHLTDTEADRLFAIYMAAYEANWQLFDDVLPCLEALSSYRLGVITNGPSIEQRRKLTRFGLTDMLHCVVVSEECGVAKPNCAIFARACTLAGTAAVDTAYIGDHAETDFRAARSAGLRSVWLNRGAPSDSVASTDTVTSLLSLTTVLNRAQTTRERPK